MEGTPMNPDDANTTHQIDTLAELAGRVAFWVVLLGLVVAFVVWAVRRSKARPAAPPGWHVEAAGTPKWRFNAPPGWPPTPPGFVPPSDWHPDPSWPAAPPAWQWWIPN